MPSNPPLRDARGFRAPYINALNAAVAASEVVAGDLDILRAPNGTTLRLPPKPRLRRFRLTLGAYDGTPAAVLTDGNLILATGRADLQAGKDVAHASTIQPSPGWYTTADLPDSPGDTLDVILARHVPTSAVYVVFQPGDASGPATPLHQLLPDTLGTLTEADVSAIVTIGRFRIPAATSSAPSPALVIDQFIADDIPALALAETAAPGPFHVSIDADDGSIATLRVKFGRIFLIGVAQTIQTNSRWTRDPDAADPDTADWLCDIPSAGDQNGQLDPYLWYDAAGTYHLSLKGTWEGSFEGDEGTILRHLAVVDANGQPPASVAQRWEGDVYLDAIGGSSLVPGPLTREETTGGQANWVRRLGTWAWSEEDGVWRFTAAANADGSLRPPIETFPERTALIRVGDDIAAIPAPLPDYQAPTTWLARREADVTIGLTYTPPTTETGSGALKGRAGAFRFWSDIDPASGPEQVILTTVVADANDQNTYQDIADAGGN